MRIKKRYLDDSECSNRWKMFCDRFYENLTWPEIAEKYGYTRDQARNLTLVIVARFGRSLYDELKKERISDKQVESELRNLMLILSKYK